MLTEADRTTGLFGDEARDERLEGFTGFWEYEPIGGLGPVELETGGEGGDPYLAYR